MSTLPVLPAQHLRSLAFEVLINREKVLDLAKNVLLHVCVILNAGEARVARGIGEDLFVANTLIEHFKEANRPRKINAAWEGRRVTEN